MKTNTLTLFTIVAVALAILPSMLIANAAAGTNSLKVNSASNTPVQMCGCSSTTSMTTTSTTTKSTTEYTTKSTTTCMSTVTTTSPTTSYSTTLKTSSTSTLQTTTIQPTSSTTVVTTTASTTTTPTTVVTTSTVVTTVPTTTISGGSPTLAISPSNTILDGGELEVYTVTVNGGTGPFNIELFNVTGSSQQGTNVTIPSSGASNTFLLPVSSPGTFTYNAIATDTSTHSVFNSISNSIIVNNALVITSFTTSNAVLDLGQITNLTAVASGGVLPYAFNFLVTNSTSGALVGNLLLRAVTSNTASYIFKPNVTGTFNIDVRVTDSAPVPESVFDPLHISVDNTGIHLSPSIANPSPGETETYTITISTGVGPFNVFLYSVTGKEQVGGNVIIAAAGDSNTVSFVTSNTGAFQYNATATDMGTNAPFTFNSLTNTIIVTASADNSLSVFATPSNTLLDSSQFETYTLKVNGGKGPFTVQLFNVTGNSPQQSNVIIATPGGTNTVTFKVSKTGTFVFNAIATDEGASNTVATSSKSSIIVNGNTNNTNGTTPNAPTVTITPSAKTLSPGQNETFTIKVFGGIGPFDIELFNVTNSTPQGSNVIIQSPGGTNTISFTAGATGLFTYNAMVTDMGPTVPFTFNSTKSQINVTSVTTTTISQGGGGGVFTGGGVGGGGGGSSHPIISTRNGCIIIDDVGVPNSFNFNLSNENFTVVDNYIGSNYTSVIVNGLTYILNLNVPTPINQSNIYMVLTNVSYLPIEHTVDMQACPSQNTTVNSITVVANYSTTKNLTIKSVVPPIFTNLTKLNNTPVAPPSPKNTTAIFITRLSVNSLSVTHINFSVNYECALKANTLQPYIVNNGAWNPINLFTTNSGACTISYGLPRDSTMGLFTKTSAPPFNPTNTIVPTKYLIVPTFPPASPLKSPWPTIIISSGLVSLILGGWRRSIVGLVKK
jgi:hypothetical protein